MRKSLEYEIGGAFKVDFYKNGKFEKSTDYFSNFITQTGLMYPLTYSFADCFRYLSIGRSSAVHSGSTTLGFYGTTGLYDPIVSFVSSEGTQGGQYIGWEGYATGEVESHCGTVLSEVGPRFYRAWYLPTGNGDVTINEAGGGLNIQEFMVSPSSGEDAIGKSAFSRVVRDLYIPNGYRTIISYQLKINIKNTGVTYFTAGSFQTGNAEVSNDSALIQDWANLSGYYRQTYHGLRCIDNLGFTYIPKFGDGMEPASTNTRKMMWYLSPDNSQFDISKTGSNQSSVNDSYISDGLMGHVRQLDLNGIVAFPEWETLDKPELTVLYNNTSPDISDNIPDDTILTNIRLGRVSSPLLLPQTDNYTVIDDNSANFTYQKKQTDLDSRTVSYATPGANGFSNYYSDFGKKAIFTSATTKLNILTGGQNAITGRKKTITRKSVFSPVSSLGYNTRFGSLVYGYQAQSNPSEGNSVYYPMIDTLFFDTSGQSLMPHYRFITGIQLTERGTGVIESYAFVSGQIGSNIFKFTPRLTFQGPYSNPIKHHLLYAPVKSNDDGSNLAGYFSGFAATGSFDSNATQGQTGYLTVNGTIYSGGFGSVYGIIADNNFYNYRWDLGLLEHNVRNLGSSATGQLYWPLVTNNNKVNLYFTGVKFYTPELGTTIISDTGNWYGSNQIVKDVNFDILTNNYTNTGITGYLKNVTGSLPNFYGYYLTRGRYYNTTLSGLDIVDTTTNYGFTGFIIPISNDNGNKFKGGIWDDAGLIPTNKLSFVPTVTSTTFSGATNRARISSLFPSITDRGYPNGTGGTPILDNDRMLICFTGFSGTVPLYLTLISGSAGFSYLSGVITTTNFRRPTGYPSHCENSGSYGYRLKPNYGLANYYGDDTYTPTVGGGYPATSLDNGTEVYLDLSWSSSCGPSSTACNEPI